MREIRLSGSEGGGTGNSTGPPYPYQRATPTSAAALSKPGPPGDLVPLPTPNNQTVLHAQVIPRPTRRRPNGGSR